MGTGSVRAPGLSRNAFVYIAMVTAAGTASRGYGLVHWHPQDWTRYQIPMGTGWSGWVAENRKSILNGNSPVEPGHLNDPSKPALAVPLESDSGVAGAIPRDHHGCDAFTPEHRRLLESFSRKLAEILENTVKA